MTFKQTTFYEISKQNFKIKRDSTKKKNNPLHTLSLSLSLSVDTCVYRSRGPSCAECERDRKKNYSYKRKIEWFTYMGHKCLIRTMASYGLTLKCRQCLKYLWRKQCVRLRCVNAVFKCTLRQCESVVKRNVENTITLPTALCQSFPIKRFANLQKKKKKPNFFHVGLSKILYSMIRCGFIPFVFILWLGIVYKSIRRNTLTLTLDGRFFF